MSMVLIDILIQCFDEIVFAACCHALTTIRDRKSTEHGQRDRNGLVSSKERPRTSTDNSCEPWLCEHAVATDHCNHMKEPGYRHKLDILSAGKKDGKRLLVLGAWSLMAVSAMKRRTAAGQVRPGRR
jgi:hypothetical protein